jgi:hypothetical protein
MHLQLHLPILLREREAVPLHHVNGRDSPRFAARDGEAEE